MKRFFRFNARGTHNRAARVEDTPVPEQHVHVVPTMESAQSENMVGSALESAQNDIVQEVTKWEPAHEDKVQVVIAWESLPPEVGARIALYLSPRDVCRAACASRRFAVLFLHNKGLWHDLYERDVLRGRLSTISTYHVHGTYRENYRRWYQRMALLRRRSANQSDHAVSFSRLPFMQKVVFVSIALPLFILYEAWRHTVFLFIDLWELVAFLASTLAHVLPEYTVRVLRQVAVALAVAAVDLCSALAGWLKIMWAGLKVVAKPLWVLVCAAVGWVVLIGQTVATAANEGCDWLFQATKHAWNVVCLFLRRGKAIGRAVGAEAMEGLHWLAGATKRVAGLGMVAGSIALQPLKEGFDSSKVMVSNGCRVLWALVRDLWWHCAMGVKGVWAISKPVMVEGWNKFCRPILDISYCGLVFVTSQIIKAYISAVTVMWNTALFLLFFFPLKATQVAGRLLLKAVEVLDQMMLAARRMAKVLAQWLLDRTVSIGGMVWNAGRILYPYWQPVMTMVCRGVGLIISVTVSAFTLAYNDAAVVGTATINTFYWLQTTLLDAYWLILDNVVWAAYDTLASILAQAAALFWEIFTWMESCVSLAHQLMECGLLWASAETEHVSSLAMGLAGEAYEECLRWLATTAR